MVYAYLRQARLQDDSFFDYPSMGKMFLSLYEHDRNNIMAAYYLKAFITLRKMEEKEL